MTSTSMEARARLALLQFADGLFPAGGFAHSFGLESYVQADLVRDGAGVAAFLDAFLVGSAGSCDAIAVSAAARAALAGDVAEVERIDDLVDAFKTTATFRDAGRQMGRQTARVAAAVALDAVLVRLAADIDASRTPGQHAAAFGCSLGRMTVDPEVVAEAFLYSTASVIVGAALRLLPLGQLEGQRILWNAHERIVTLARAAAASSVEDMWSFAPGIEIAGMRHATLTQRLFRS